MSFSKENDVKTHLSRRIRKTILPFKPAAEPDSKGCSIEEQNCSPTCTSSAISTRDRTSVAVSISTRLPA